MNDPSPDIILRGAWRGQPGAPDRTFHGTVVQSSHPQVPVDAGISVTFEHSGSRVTGASDHGTYVLHLAGPSSIRVVLSRFSSQAASSTHAHDETSDDEWYALPARP
ncbi:MULTISPECIES: hypothetical protein [Deinococcus]|uniref:Carboxypeptidase regulatory-like domain-containing protein n=1 Tax=Deinococcus rufus TaxID=2136097 RepID=A0ABV7Z8Y0_9DEIO|nr:hypothetical protein [Deinococcus sp. AB2017081]WQE96238.1 hypothetical protein U2P90_04905 [Deinococcus sp. AB2017081]